MRTTMALGPTAPSQHFSHWVAPSRESTQRSCKESNLCITIEIGLSFFFYSAVSHLYFETYCHGICYEMHNSSRSFRSLPNAHVYAHAHLAVLSGNAVCMMAASMVRTHTRNVLCRLPRGCVHCFQSVVRKLYRIQSMVNPRTEMRWGIDSVKFKYGVNLISAYGNKFQTSVCVYNTLATCFLERIQ